MFLEITSAVTALTLLVLAVCLIPVLLELKRTAISLRTFTETMQGEIKPLVKELRDTVADIQVVTGSAAANAEGVNVLLEELGHAGHNIVLYARLAEVAGEYLSKGKNVYLDGKLKTRKWQDRDGKDRYTTEIIGDKLLMLGSKHGSIPDGSDDQPPNKLENR